MEEISEKEFKRVVSHCLRYSHSLQHVTYTRLGKFYHDNSKQPLAFIYLCPICLKNKVGITKKESYHSDDKFTIDHFPPQSVGGKEAILVCKTCNNTAGNEYDFALKDWLQEQAFINNTPNSRYPITVRFDGVSGNFREYLVSTGEAFSYNFNRFSRYPPVNKVMDDIIAGKSIKQIINIKATSIKLVNRALLKAGYLKAFAIWGYDFIYSYTGMRIRDIITNDSSHILSNYGIFFHSEDNLPQDGLAYVYTPISRQTFMLNITLTDKDSNYKCGVSILLPGPDPEDWAQLHSYQSVINQREEHFTQEFIQLPENTLTPQKHFPYTETWKTRHRLRIQGFNA